MKKYAFTRKIQYKTGCRIAKTAVVFVFEP